MLLRSSFERALFVTLTLLLGGGLFAALLGCSAASEPPLPKEALGSRFPEQAREVHGAGPGFLATAEGFVARAPEASPGGFRLAGERFEVVLPRKGEEGLVFQGQQGFALRVRELEAAGEGALEESAVTYERPGGRSYWTAMPGGGAEEWLLLSAARVTRDEPVAVWEVEGATLRAVEGEAVEGEAVEVMDEAGRVRLRVTAPRAYAEGGRPIAARLGVSASRVKLFVEASGEAVLVDPAWVPAVSMSVTRDFASATLLPSGKVLIAGGFSNLGNTTKSVDLYDLTTGTFQATTPMNVARALHTATLLQDGKVLVAGGNSKYFLANQPSLASAEIFDPATSTWTPVNDMQDGREIHTATLLPNGNVLVAGGYFPALLSAEIFDPVTGDWTAMSNPNGTYVGDTATLLPNGKVLIAQSGELFDPTTNTFTSIAPSDVGVFHTATLLPGGKVLVAGGMSGDPAPMSFSSATATAKLFDSGTQSWLPASPMNSARGLHTATLLPGGKVLFAGGVNSHNHYAFEVGTGLSTAELFDPVTGSFTTTSSMSIDRSDHTATLLPDGNVLIAGGLKHKLNSPQFGNGTLSSAEIFSSAIGSFMPVATTLTPRAGHTATHLYNGKILVVGGTSTGSYESPGSPLPTAELFDPMTKSWASVDAMSVARAEHTATLLQNGKVLVVGGGNVFVNGTRSAELFDPTTSTWTALPELTTARYRHTATLLPDGRVLVAGGESETLGQATSAAEVFDPQAGIWTTVGSMSGARFYHSATLVQGGQVLLAGGYVTITQSPLKTAELFDPATGSFTPIVETTLLGAKHTATLLPEGKVLFAGGYMGLGYSGPSDAAKLFDPATQSFSSPISMKATHAQHVATLLPSGQVLLVGSYGFKTPFLTDISSPVAEVFDPATGTFSLVDPITSSRGSLTATLLPSGEVVVVGGQNLASVFATVEVFHPNRLWARAGSMSSGRVHHTATYLPSTNKVLVAGGEGSFGHVATADLYDAVAGTWSSTGAMTDSRAFHTATWMPSAGEVLVAGGQGASGPLATALRYSAAAKTWSAASSMSAGRAFHTATWLPSTAKVLLAGGFGASGPLSGGELYDPTGNLWTPTGSMAAARWQHTATLLADGRVLVAGGIGSGGPLSSAELFDPANGAWASAQTMDLARAGHTATLLPSGMVLVAGGVNSVGTLSAAALFDPAAVTWAPIAPMLHARTDHIAGLLPDGRVLVAGGADEEGALDSAEIFDPATTLWIEVRPLRLARTEGKGTELLVNGSILMTGGTGDGGAPLSIAELFTLLPNGTLCEASGDCSKGHCVDAVCCDTACAEGPCDVCSVATEITSVGAEDAGTCQLLTGPACSDGDACSQADTCQAGICQGASPVLCAAPDQCHEVGTCNSVTGACSAPTNKADTVACNDSDACTPQDVCLSGVCTGLDPIVCPPPDQCHKQGTCDPATGNCIYPAKDEGASCDDKNACTTLDRCQSEVCAGLSPVVCPPPDACHDQGTCHPDTGLCDNPAKSEGASCDDQNACTTLDRCQSEVCTGFHRVVCPPPDQCHKQGTCDTATGACDDPVKDDGATCDSDGDPCTAGDHCEAGACVVGAPRICGAYACDKSTGQCLKECKSVEDCTSGNVCDPMGQCIVARFESSVSESGCAVTPSGGAGGSPFRQAALALLALSALAFRRQSLRVQAARCSRRHRGGAGHHLRDDARSPLQIARRVQRRDAGAQQRSAAKGRGRDHRVDVDATAQERLRGPQARELVVQVNGHDRTGRAAGGQRERAQRRAPAVGEAAKVDHALRLGRQDLEGSVARGERSRGDCRREQRAPRVEADPVNDVRRTRDPAAHGGQALGQGPGQNVGSERQTELLLAPFAASTQHAQAVGLIERQTRAAAAAHTDELG
jgi:MYXO-CTERM domain-containing protein